MPEIFVKGMSCGHCAQSVARALESLAGISQVKVDLAAGRVAYENTGAASPEDVAGVIKAAGYEVV